MTLGEGKRKVLMLLDEFSSGGALTQDLDISNKMADFFDMAQKDVAMVKPIYRQQRVEIRESDGEQLIKIPADCREMFRIWKDGRIVSMLAIRGDSLVVPASRSGTFILEYRAIPQTVSAETKDEYVFEVDEDAAECMPYFVAAMQLIPDLVVDYGAFWSIYQNKLSMLDRTEPTGGVTRVRQTLFGSRR